MKDSAGVNRGHCKDCGVDKCSDYKIQKKKMFADIVDTIQLSMHAKIPEKIIQAKKQNNDLGDAIYNDVNDELERYSLNSICCHHKSSAVIVLCLQKSQKYSQLPA